jgi:hypothetical protein
VHTIINNREAYIAIISARRPDAVQKMTKVLGIETVTWYVSKDDCDDAYRSEGARRIMRTGTLCASRNAALEDAFERNLPCIQLSDDLGAMAEPVWSAEKGKFIAQPVPFRHVFEGLVDGLRTGAKLVGAAPTANPFYYRGKSIHNRAFIVGDCMCVAPSEPRFDEKLKLKEDYAFTIDHLKKYGMVARKDDLLLTFAHRTNKGGAVAYRTPELEQETIAYLQQKYPGWLKPNPRRPNEILLRTR